MGGGGGVRVTVGSGLGGALSRDVSGLAALVAGLADSVEWPSVGGGAVA